MIELNIIFELSLFLTNVMDLKESSLVFGILLDVTLLFEGGCSEPLASIYGGDLKIPTGAAFKISCRFTCLRFHVAQMWKTNDIKVFISIIQT